MLSRSVKGSVALITGAGSGVGRATAEVFAAEGAHVAVTDFNEVSARATADAISAQGDSAKAWGLDVTDTSRIRIVVGEIVAA
jgi:3-oxoacyl-[acyl-carrier protein] reductase